MSAIKSAWQQNQKSRRRKSSESMSAEVSPDSKCPICLDRFNNISYLDLCLHKFCFCCIHEWSKNKAECPLCKQPFKSIYHSIRSEQDFKKYDLQPVNNGSFGSFGGVRFRYRTTLTGVSREMRRRTPPIFEASTVPPQQPQERYVRRMMMRLEAKRQAAREGRAVNTVREQEMVNFRRELYRQGVRVRMVRDGGRSRDTSAEFYRRNPACLHRLVPWLKRELTVLYGSHGSLVNIVQHVIMSCITRFDMEDGAILEELRPFIQGRTEHFLHEFINFAKSPFNVEAYDQHAVYDCPAPSSNEDGSSNSSVIAISEDEDLAMNLGPPGETTSTLSDSVWDDETPGPSYSTRTEQSRAEHLSVLDTDSDNSFEEETQEFDASPLQMRPHNETNKTQDKVSKEEDSSPDNDDCVIVGFVKPTVDRTPELVQLSSDSEESDSEDTTEVPHLPQHIRFTSPPALQSCDPSGARQTENVEMDYKHQLDSKVKCSSTSSRSKTSRKSDRKDRNGGSDRNERSKERHWSRDRDQRRRRRSSTREHKHNNRRLQSPPNSSNMLSRGRDYHFDSCSKRRGNYKSNQSDRHYCRERNGSETHYTERRSYYCSSRTFKDRQAYCHSRSRSRDSPRRDRRHSRSFSSSRSPSAKSKSHHDKPGGKRKYKTRHLEEPSKSTFSNSYREEDASMQLAKHKKRSKEKHRKKSKERSRKTSRSLSVELVTQEYTHERSKRHHKKKKKHKKKSKKHKSDEHTEKRSPAIITIDSDSDSFANNSGTQACSTSQDNAIDSITNNPPALTCL